jgi:hypothetical protein
MLGEGIERFDAALRGAVLALGLRASAADPKVLETAAFAAVLDQLLADHEVVQAMLESEVSDLPVVMCTLALASDHWFQADARKEGFTLIVESVEFSVAMDSGSASFLLDEVLARFGANILSLRRRPMRSLLRCTFTQHACRGSMEAMARPLLMQAVFDRSRSAGKSRSRALIEGLMVLDQAQRMPLFEGVVLAAGKRAEMSSVDKSLFAQPISLAPTWRSAWTAPSVVIKDERLLATWLGAGVADARTGDLLESLAGVIRRQRKNSRRKDWLDSAPGLVFAIRLALRASKGLVEGPSEGVGSPALRRGSRKAGRPELFAQASVLACRFVLKGRVLPVSQDAQAALLAHLMCAALALDMDDAAPCLDHLQWVEEHEDRVEEGKLRPSWFSDLRKKLNAELQALTT